MKHVLGAVAIVGSLVASPDLAFAQAANRAITIVIPGNMDLFDPCRTSTDEVGRVIKQNVTETLTELNPADGSIMPRLALSWEQFGQKSWRFKLRQGVKFHGGAAFNATAVASAIARMLNPNIDCGVRQQYFGGVKIEAKVVDDQTIELTPEPALANLPTLMTLLAIGGPNTPADKLETRPIGTGPYVFESLEPGQKAVLRRSNDYWGTKPEVEMATYLARKDSAVAAAMVKTGEADLAPYIDVQDANDPATDVSYLNAETSRVAITLKPPPLNDVRVRTALNLALDREAFIGTIFSKDAKMATQVVVPFNNGYNPDLKVWPYDPARAKALLAEAKAAGVPVDRQITLFGRPGFFPNTPDVLTALAEMWKAVGFNITTQMIERGQFSERKRQTKQGPNERQLSLFLDSHGNASGDAGASLFFNFHSESTSSEIQDPKVDALINEGRMAAGAERTKKFQEVFKLAAETFVVDVPLYHMVGFARVSPRLAFTPTPLTSTELQIARIGFKK